MLADLALPSVVVVTGTGTELGKTMTTAAFAVTLRLRGLRVAVVKVAQTGVADDEPGDADEVRRLVGDDDGVTTHELLRLPDPLAPDTAARRAGVDLPPVAAHARRIAEIAADADVTLVEGSGGLLVRLDSRGGTLADLARALRYKGVSTGAVVVAAAGLGALNVTALTAEALAVREIPLLGVVIGSWPAEPDLAARCNVDDLPTVAGAPVLGALPEGVGALGPEDFQSTAPSWLEPPVVAVSTS